MRTTNDNPNKETSRSQCARMLQYMKAGHGITGLEAVTMFGCMSTASHQGPQRGGQRHQGRVDTTDSGKRVKRYTLA